MADTVIERLLYRIEADTKQLRSDFAQAQASAQKAGQQIGGSLEKASTRASAASSIMSKSMDSLGRQIRSAAAAYVSFRAVVGGTKAFVNAADAANRMENRLKLVTSSTEELTKVQGQLFDVSQATLAPLQGTVELYTRVSMAAKTLGTSQQEVLTLTKAVNQAIALSGATASEASAGVIQFAQGLASGRLQGDELRSVLENLPRLGKAIADGMGITIGQLRELGAEGKTIPKEVIAAILREAPKIAEEMGKIVPTVEQSLVRLQNAFVAWASAIDDTIKITPALRGFIGDLTLEMDMQTASLRDNRSEYEKLRDRAVELTGSINRLQTQLDGLSGSMAPFAVKELKDEIISLNTELTKNQELQQSISKTSVRFDPSADTKASQSKAATVAIGMDDPSFVKAQEASKKLLDQLREDTLRANGDIAAAERANSERRIADIRKRVSEEKITKEAGAKAEAEIHKQLNAKLKQLDDDRLKDVKASREAEAEERIDQYRRIQEANNKVQEEAARAAEEIQSSFRQSAESISYNFLEAARKGASAMDLLRQVANDVLSEINRRIAQSLAEMAFPTGGGGGGLGGLLSGAFSGLFGASGASPAMGGGGSYVIAAPGGSFAKGDAFPGPLHKYANGGAFSNSVVTGPTRFRAANGAGLMGEAGAEAIMPLARTPDGKLGVQAVGGNGGGGMTVFIDARGADPAAIARLERGFNSLNASIENRAVDSVMKTQLRGGNFSRAF